MGLRRFRLHVGMSKNRENVIWQSADGRWNRGFFETYPTKSYDDDDYDDEWDVDYDYDNFSWVSVGHLTEQAAYASWDGANPGGSTVYAHGESSWPNEPPVAEKFDEMAVACAAKGYYAPGVSAVKVQDYKDRAVISRFYFTQRSYDPKTKNLSDFFAAEDAKQAKEVSTLLARRPELADYARECRQKVADVDEKEIERARERAREASRWGGRSTYVSDAMSKSAAVAGLLDKVKIPVTSKEQPASAAKSSRGKTTAASTAGSFAPKVGSQPEVSLNLGALSDS